MVHLAGGTCALVCKNPFICVGIDAVVAVIFIVDVNVVVVKIWP